MEASVAIPPTIPAVGTPEFREFVQTQAWRDLQYDRALADDAAETRRANAAIAARQPIDMHVRELGATGICSSKIWSRDYRERFPIDHPDRIDYEESVYGMTERDLIAQDVVNLGKLHHLILRITTIDRG